MSEEQQETTDNEDGFVDALSAIVVIVLPVVTIVYWLSGLPTS